MRLIAIITFSLICLALKGQNKISKPQIGIAEKITNDSIVSAIRFDCIIESIGRLIAPKNVSDAQFAENLSKFKALKTPIYAFNLFLPGDLKLVGPDVDEKKVLEYVEIVVQRVSQTDTKMIVWGSGGSRRIPENWDKSVAIGQFTSIAKKIADIAKSYNIILALEPLNTSETNFINSVEEALSILHKVNHPNLKLNVDLYHMLKDNESPTIIAKTRKYIVHCEIAEKDNRTAPGVVGTDFKPYLLELAKIKYHNKIVIEGSWKNLADIGLMSKTFLQKQIDEVYK